MHRSIDPELDLVWSASSPSRSKPSGPRGRIPIMWSSGSRRARGAPWPARSICGPAASSERSCGAPGRRARRRRYSGRRAGGPEPRDPDGDAAGTRLTRGPRRFFRWLLRGPRHDGEAPRRWWRRLGSGLARLAVGLVLASVLSVGLLRWIPPFTTAFILRERAFGDTPVAHHWTPWPQISPDAALAVVAAEDQRFPMHWGFDLVEIEKAVEGGARRGASTISQQVAKNLYLWPGGGYFRKGIEAWFTILIEALWPKRRILEVYLNVAEFGPGVFGVGEAARRYFGKEPAALTATEAALLAAVLPSPKRMSVARPGPYVLGRTGQILAQMRQLGGRSYLEGP